MPPRRGAKTSKEPKAPPPDLAALIDAAAAAPPAGAAPPPRTSFTFALTRSGSFIIFGGELYDARVCKVFNDCYKWSPDKDASVWKRAAPGAIKPRVGHASCVLEDDVYIHGGEFATSSQFYHYKDFWRLDAKLMQWTPLPVTNGPSPRSGHRLVISRGALLVFGGFHDNGREVRYFNDLYAYNSTKWTKLVAANAPSPRSAAIVAANNDQLVVSGGFAKIKDTQRDCQGTFLDDIWFLDLRTWHEAPNAPLRWERSRKRALTRAGVAQCQHKNLVYAFGGVVDSDAGGTSYGSSFFFNDIWQLDLLSKVWTRVRMAAEDAAAEKSLLRAFRPTSSAAQIVLLSVDGLQAATAAAVKAPITAAGEDTLRDAGVVRKLDQKVDYRADPTKLLEPLPRSNAAIAVKGNHIYLYGGSLEREHSSNIIFDDAWRFHLRQREWECLAPGQYWQQVVVSESLSSDSTGESGSECESESRSGSDVVLEDEDEEESSGIE